MSAILDIPLKLINHENKGVRWLSFAVLLIIATAWSTLKYADVKADQNALKITVEQQGKKMEKYETGLEKMYEIQKDVAEIKGILKGRYSR